MSINIQGAIKLVRQNEFPPLFLTDNTDTKMVIAQCKNYREWLGGRLHHLIMPSKYKV